MKWHIIDYGDHEDRQKGGFGDRRSGFSERRTYSRGTFFCSPNK